MTQHIWTHCVTELKGAYQEAPFDGVQKNRVALGRLKMYRLLA